MVGQKTGPHKDSVSSEDGKDSPQSQGVIRVHTHLVPPEGELSVLLEEGRDKATDERVDECRRNNPDPNP